MVTDAGCRDVGLPATYPLDSRRRIVPSALPADRPAGLGGRAARAWRPAAPTGDGEELAYFGRRKLRRGAVRMFEDWFWEPAPSCYARVAPSPLR